MMSSEAVLRMAAELSAPAAEEFIAKMRSDDIDGDSLRILHNYVKGRLGSIVNARRIDREALIKWADVDSEVEAMLAKVYLF